MEISRKEADRLKNVADYAVEISDMNGQDHLLVGNFMFTIKGDMDADEKAEKEKEVLDKVDNI